MDEDTRCVVDRGGTKAWYKGSKYHRLDGPAIEYFNGTRAWYVDGKLHRIGKPAIEHAGRMNSYYVHGKLHRADGPAIERPGEDHSWYVNDVDITAKVDAWIREMNLPYYSKWTDSHKMLFKLTWG